MRTLRLKIEELEARIAPGHFGNAVSSGQTPNPSGGGGGGSNGESNGNAGNEVSNGASPQPR